MSDAEKEVPVLNIRTKEQYEATKRWLESEETTGCASWCNREEQKSPVVLETKFFEIRQEAPEYKKPGVDRWFIISKRHASLMELTPEEGADLLLAKQVVNREFDIKGCFINREGPKKNTASSLPDDHYYEIAVKTTPGVPYAETLVKDLTGENLKRLEDRAKTFTE